MMGIRLVRVSVGMLLAVLAGCGEGTAKWVEETAGSAEGHGAIASRGVVDSIRPMDEEIRRFAATVDHRPAGLTGGAASLDELVRSFITALERADTAALARAHIDRAEFIHLYFPHTRYTEPPYEMSPSFIWFQMMNLSNQGMTRAYRRFGGRPLAYRGYDCAPPVVEGPNRLRERCVVRIAPDDEMVVRLFGQVIERDGQFKFVTYGNDL